MKSHNLIKSLFNFTVIFSITFVLASCGGGGSKDKDKDDDAVVVVPQAAAMATLNFDIKTFQFSWTDVEDATFYRLMENADGVSGFTQVSGDIAQGAQAFNHTVALYLRTGASYFLQSCNSAGCVDGDTISVTGTLASAIGYFKASNTDASSFLADDFGIDVALSADGTTMAVGAQGEASDADGINGNENDENADAAGAVYVYANNAGNWSQQAYIKASVSTDGDMFGAAVSLSADGNTLAVGAPLEGGTGRVYMFTRSGSSWTELENFNALVSGADFFGDAVSLSDDGSTLAVGAKAEDNPNSIIGIDDGITGLSSAGAAYIFIEVSGSWMQQVYIKAGNVGADEFGDVVSLSSDGNTLAVGAPGEDGDATSTDSTPNNGANRAGAVYVYTRIGVMWSQQKYIKASNTDIGDEFGTSISLSDDGNTMAIGAVAEDSVATGIGGAEADGALNSGATYVFVRSGTNWSQQAYVKASNTDVGDNFGRSVSLSADGNILAVGATGEQSSALGINGDEVTGAVNNAGASYLYVRDAGVWFQQAYIKASNTGDDDSFGSSIEISGDGNTLAVGANREDGNATGIGGDQTNNSSLGAGAVYLY